METVPTIKMFKRFLKENNFYIPYVKFTQTKYGIENTLKNKQIIEYFSPKLINKQQTEKYKISTHYLATLFDLYNIEWNNYYKYNKNKKIYIEKFKTFLKKRGILNLYQTCFSPYYVNFNANILYNARINQMFKVVFNTNLKHKYINTWEELYPNEFIIKAFDNTDTIKNESFWIELNKKWQEELKKIEKILSKK